MSWEILIPVVTAAAGMAAGWWLKRTPEDGKDTPVLDAIAKLLAQYLGRTPPAPQPAPQPAPPSDTPVLDAIRKLLDEFMDRLSKQQGPQQTQQPMTQHIPVKVTLTPHIEPPQQP